MALIVGGTTVTGTQTLDASKLTGTAQAFNGSNITSIPAPSNAQILAGVASGGIGDVGTTACLYYGGSDNGIAPGSNYNTSYLKFGSCGGGTSNTASGTWKIMGTSLQNNAAMRASVWTRVS